ncbi:hypothetical protein JTE90_013720 [Oedothorax gibbosus]|uniref:Uncharacterized protein n=1 Tax=Oedothorax gibbosus TaxID=931172 RepID=A0AAV6UXZ9_9ARAC|nr:hypothetical protein JTE90_013720 [Oedothorax gibbosus]
MICLECGDPRARVKAARRTGWNVLRSRRPKRRSGDTARVSEVTRYPETRARVGVAKYPRQDCNSSPHETPPRS